MKKLWLTQIPIILIFTFFFWVTELGVNGQAENQFLRETLYPKLSKPSYILTNLKFNARGLRPPKNKILVVEVDSESIEAFGRWPWHRDVTAYLIGKSFELGAKVVGLDMTFSEPDPRIPPKLLTFLKEKNLDQSALQFETDPFLEQVIRFNSKKLVMGWASEVTCQPLYDGAEFCPVTNPQALSTFPKDFERFAFEHFIREPTFDPVKVPMISYVTPLANIPPFTAASTHAGFFNTNLDGDGFIRRTNLFAFAKGLPFPSLALNMAKVGLGEELKLELDSKQRVRFLGFAKSGRAIPVTPLGVMQINFRGASSVFSHVSAVDLLRDAPNFSQDSPDKSVAGKLKTDVLKDAYLLVGVSALGVFDMRQMPFEENTPGVYGHANILDNLLSGDPLVSSSSSTGSTILFIIMTFGVLLFSYAIERLSAVPALLLILGTFASIGGIDFLYLFPNNENWNTVFLYLEIGTVFILILAAKYVIEERNKKFIRGAFSKYVSPEVVDSILKDPTKLSLGGEKRELTIMFSDIRSFTTFSEKMDAKTLASFLNDYLGIMTGLVYANHGTLDKYIGDAVMAFWGAPLDQPKHATNACKTAVQMLQALEQNVERYKRDYGIDVAVGLGINSGVVNVGNMGSEQNFEYTVIGDRVNLASRMEGLTKKYGVTMVTSRYTFDCITATGDELPHHRILDDVKVKGKKKAVELIQLLERQYPAESLALFAEGRSLYQKQKWDEAISKFEECNKIVKEAFGKADGPSEIFIERCQGFKAEPPEADWDGSWEMDSK